MIPWVDEHCRSWAKHKRWLMFGSHGWPAQSVLAKLIREGAGAGHSTFRARVPVKDSPPAYRLVNAALVKMAETHAMEHAHAVVHWHYLGNGRAAAKAPEIGISLAKYWQELHAAHAFIAGCDLSANQPSESAVS